MMRVFVSKGACLSQIETGPTEIPPDALWVDLSDPSADEKKRVEDQFHLVIPTREEMQEIEASSRLYHEDGAIFMTATIVSGADTENPESNAVTFILTGGHLITVRHSDPKPFTSFPQRATRQPGLWASGERVLVGLLEAIIDRTADILEHVSYDVDVLSKEIFGARTRKVALDSEDFQDVLFRLGRENDLCARVRESLISFNRMVTFLTPATDVKASKDLKGHVKTLTRDVLSLSDHTSYLSNKIQFLLDATLGLISIEQNKVIKVLAVVGTVLGPPTLLASIWGMNFHNMPELSAPLGYTIALGVIAISGLGPFLYFKFRNWL